MNINMREIFPIASKAIEENDINKLIEIINSNNEILNVMTPFGTWLHYAATLGKLSIVEKLVEMGLDVNTRGGTYDTGALKYSTSEGHIDIVKYLISHGAEFDTRKSTSNALFGAITGGHLEVVKLLIESGFDYTVKYSGDIRKDVDALEHAKTLEQTEIVKYLESVIGSTSQDKAIELYNNNISNVKMGDLKIKLKNAVIKQYKILRDTYPEEIFYGYSLQTSDDISGIYPVANKISSITVEKSDPMYNVYRYCPDEWSDWDDFGVFEEVNQFIKKLYEEMNEKFAEFKKGVLNQALETLTELESEGLFGEKNDDRFLVVWVSDSSNEIKRVSAEKLNSIKVFNEFATLL